MERPELASLLTFAKRRVKRSLLDSPLLDDPWLERDLRDYFPHAVVERFAPLLGEHPLRRELIATVNANLVVNALGSVFVSQLVAERGAAPAEVVRAYRIAREVTGAEADWEAIETLGGKIDPAVQVELMAGVDGLVDAVTRWYLSEGLTRDLGETIEAGRVGLREAGRGGAAARRRRAPPRAARRSPTRLVAAGVPEGLAEAHALRPALVHAPVGGRGRAAPPSGAVEDVALAFFTVGDLLPLDGLEAELDTVPVAGRMQRWALQAVREDAPPRPPRDRRARAHGDAERRAGGGGLGLPRRASRGLPAAGGVHAHALARDRRRTWRDRAGGAAVAVADGVGLRRRSLAL